MSRKAWIAIAAAAVFVAALGFWLGRPEESGIQEGGPPTDSKAGTEASPESGQTTRPAELFFPGEGERLYAERRGVADGEPEARTAALVQALLDGPRAQAGTSLRSPLPDGTLLGGVFLLGGDTAVVDLVSEQHPSPPSVGSKRELLSVYSLVNTVVLDVDDIDKLALTWNGRQPETFGGHLDLRRALTSDDALIERR